VKEIAALVLAVLAVSWASIFIRLSSAPPLIISFYRLAIAALVLAPFAALQGVSLRERAGGDQGHWTWLRNPAAVWSTLGAGFLLAMHFASWIASLRLTSVASSVVLVTTMPVFAALLSARLLGEGAGPASWAGIALSVAGSTLIAWGDYRGGPRSLPADTTRALLGDALALAGAIFGAAYLTIGRRMRSRAPLVGYLTVVYATGAVVIAAWAAARGDPFTGYAPHEYALFATIAIVPNLMGHSLLNWAVRRMRTYVVNVAALGEPVLATLYAAVLFHEIPGLPWGIGTALIVSGVLTVFLAERSRRRADTPGVDVMA
jgi:drug/metabolite transporter (DMT)-like permease